MSDARKFKFVSPGIFLNEIDQSQIPVTPENVGPAIIGRAEKGPGMTPTKVGSFSEFVETFGYPISGRGGTLDVWRDGNYASPTYAAYAAQAYLESAVAPLTFVRLMGTQHPDATAAGNAGWTTTNTPDKVLASNGGPYGLIVWPSASAGNQNSTAARCTVTFSGFPTADQTIAIIDRFGTTKTYTAKASETAASLEFDRGSGGASSTAASLKNCIEHANGHNGTILVDINAGANILTLTQGPGLGAQPGDELKGLEAGNTTVTENLDNCVVAGTPVTTSNQFTGGTTATAREGTIAAVWYCYSGSVPVLSGNAVKGDNSPPQVQGVGTVVRSDSQGQFNVKIVRDYNMTTAEETTVDDDIVFSLNESSDNFIRKAFNTNPQIVNSTIENTNNLKNYWLGETYERYISDRGLNSGQLYGAVVALTTGSVEYGNHEKRMAYRDAHSGWFFSQNTSGDAASYEYDNMTKLFKFVGIDGHGEWLQNNIKISITNIKAPGNDAEQYGTFDVLVRKASDSDLAPVVLERYSRCNLNPGSLNYIANKIGDAYKVYDEEENRYREFGDYANLSRYIRVVVSEEISNGGASPVLLPFGVYGPPRFPKFAFGSGSTGKTGNATGTSYAMASGSVPSGSSTFTDHKNTLTRRREGSFEYVYAGNSSDSGFGAAAITASAVATRSTATADGSKPTKNTYFGLHTGKSSTNTVFDPGYSDYLKAFGENIISDAAWSDSFGLSALPGNLEYSWKFSLDELELTTGATFSATSPAKGISESTWTSGSYKSGASWNAADSLSKGATRYQNILDSKAGRFTSPLFGAYDGLDITERDPFRNTLLEDTTSISELNSSPYYTLRRAVNVVSDPEVVECNVMSIPGITYESITKYVVDTCEERADALAVIDLKGGYQPRHESSDSESDRKGDLAAVLSNMKARNLNSSYGCCYYPWVTVRDDLNGTFLKMPPSVVALGVLGSTERTNDVWFAPAGFNRGGLSQGAGGLPVTSVETRLTSKNRDDLYAINVNPIASFPEEGIVVFGQKTLQATPSALDRINVRRLMIFVKKGISRIATNTMFQPNVQATWNGFKASAENFLSDVKIRFGVDDFRVVLDETTTTPDLIDRNILYAKIFIKPTRAIEFIAIDFIITRSGASFED